MTHQPSFDPPANTNTPEQTDGIRVGQSRESRAAPQEGGAVVVIPCLRCGEPTHVLADHIRHGSVCDACVALDERRKRLEKRRGEIARNWLKVCPPDYTDTTVDKLPAPTYSKIAMEWPFKGPRGANIKPGTGLNLFGWPRTGKTRTMFLVLQREHFAGRSVRVLGPGEFANGCEDRNWKTSPWIRSLCNYDILALDDVDKCKMRVTHEEKFFSVIDYRFRHQKPTFYTGNSNGEQLKTMFRNGEALVARIREQCLSVYFPKPQLQLL